MKLTTYVLAAVLGIFGLMASAVPASADHRYDGYRYHRGRDRGEVYRREALRERLFRLADRTRLAAREGCISPRRADDIFEDLDDVRDFLRGDRYLTDSEFRRRRDDLDDVADDLRRHDRCRDGCDLHGRRYRRW